MNRALVPLALAGAILATAVVFYVDPAIDLNVGSLFYRGKNTFVGVTPVGEMVRRLLYWVPTVLLLVFAALFLARRSWMPSLWAPSGRGLIMLIVSFAVGPGLLVNTILKDHSHRPRPYQTINFGGTAAFRPFYTFDGDCNRNCSFVSGEGASSMWTIAPALLTPPAIRVAAVAASIVFASAAGLLRMAFGGHYLSDTIFAALFTLSVIWATWRLIMPRPGYGIHTSSRERRSSRLPLRKKVPRSGG